MENGTFILLYLKVPKNLPPPPSGVTHPHTIQTATIWSLELGNIKGLWKKLIESENITKITFPILGNRNFILLYSKFPDPASTHPEWPHIVTIQAVKINGIWKKLIESKKKILEKHYQHSETRKWVIHSTISKFIERPHAQSGTPAATKNH